MTSLIELPTIPADPPQGDHAGERDRLIRRAKALSWLSLAWMTVEGTVAITAALVAGSVAPLGFGIDSAIEGLASVIVIWRFTGVRRLSEHAEERAQKAVAVSFFLLAPYIAPGRHPCAHCWRSSFDELGRDRPVGQLDPRDAAPRSRQAAGRRAPRLRRDSR